MIDVIFNMFKLLIIILNMIALSFGERGDLISFYGMDYKKAIAYTLVVVGLFYNAVGAFILGMLTNIAWSILPALLLGSLIGGYVGAKISLSRSNQTIKIVYQIVTISVGLSLIY